MSLSIENQVISLPKFSYTFGKNPDIPLMCLINGAIFAETAVSTAMSVSATLLKGSFYLCCMVSNLSNMK